MELFLDSVGEGSHDPVPFCLGFEGGITPPPGPAPRHGWFPLLAPFTGCRATWRKSLLILRNQSSLSLFSTPPAPLLILAWVPMRSGAAHVRREVTAVGNQNPADLPEPKLSSRDDTGATSFGAVTPRHNSPTARGGMFLAAYHDSLQGFTSTAWRQGASKVAFYEISRYQKLGPKTSLAKIMGPGKKRQRLD